MSPPELLKEAEQEFDHLAAALAADLKRNKVDRHAKYKLKRLAELTSLKNNFDRRIEEIEESVEDPNDPCITALKVKFNTAYKAYTERLEAIPEDNDESGGSSSGNNSNNEAKKLIQIQWNRFVNIQKILTDINTDGLNEEPMTEAYITIKLQRIKDIWNKLESDNDLINITDAAYRQEYVDTEKTVELHLIKLTDIQNQLKRKVAPTTEGLKLNRIDIPKFGGDYFKWVTFRDLFESLVIQNKNLPNAHKMQMLKTHVSGEAEAIINDLVISDVNFDCAWKRLLSRYDNNRVVVYKLLNKLINQPSSKGDAKSIKRILDTTDQILLALKNMKRPTDNWDDWVVVVITQKFSDDTHREWERTLGNSDVLPTWTQLKDFLEENFRMMERLEGNHKGNTKNVGQENVKTSAKPAVKVFQTSIRSACVVCQDTHTLYNCPKWKDMEPKDRAALVKKQKWCRRCLKPFESGHECDKTCRKCSKNHSTWLHENRQEEKPLVVSYGGIDAGFHTLLATASIRTTDVNGKTILLRVLIDSGAEGCLMTKAAADKLQIPTTISDRFLQGLVGHESNRMRKLQLNIQPRFESKFELGLTFYILPTLTKMLPGHNVNTNAWKHIKKLVWADPKFYKKGPIDALLGMDAIVEIIKPGLIKGTRGQPMAQETQLGWIMSGRVDTTYPANELKCLVVGVNDVKRDLMQFWEIEELHPDRSLTHEEIECEEFYTSTVQLNNNDKWLVKIPFKKDGQGPERLGESKGQAIARFLQMEKKLLRDKSLGTEYKRVMDEYLSMGHMRDVTDEPQSNKKYYIPHHAVVKPDHLTTKVRVVYDASAKSTSGISLNDCMHIGARQQRDLSDILINWRIYATVYKADISKMYRMIELDKKDQQYHTIVWRSSPNDPLKEYQLTTTTFGTAAAPFLATRTLVHMADVVKDTYPLASQSLRNDFYVDDCIGGNHDFQTAVQCKNELLAVTGQHHLELRKWTSNDPKFLADLSPEITEKSLQSFGEDDITKALGLSWNPHSDEFLFKINWINTNQTTWTKRQFLAEASKLFDPLGWLAPITINAKLMMQEIWISQIGWDVEIPNDIAERWMQFRREFAELENIRINRWIDFNPGCEISLHGFSDASEKAYSAVIYARVKKDGDVSTHLITSKTRVSPIKSKITLPRLELCGAVLVSNLMKTTQKALNLENASIRLWTDSMITLGWVQKDPSKWKTFIANRVAEIQSNKEASWNYVPTDQNPADCASRGLMPGELINHPLWWKGPEWLKQDPTEWPTTDIVDHDLEQRKELSVNVASFTPEISERYSSWNKLKAITAYALRFKTKNKGPLTVAELRLASETLIRKLQQECFHDEIHALSNGKQLNKTSKLLSLNVFLDEKGLLRVGGRLENSQLSYTMKHPVVLPAQAHVTKLIIHQMHLDTLHGGPKLMQSLLTRQYWILQCRNMVKTEFTQCIRCRKVKADTYTQQMGNLPPARVTLTRPFCHTGVDYAGPIEIKSSNLKSARIQKGYVAVYVCLGTKAVHLELVSDMTTNAFLASFDRFAARRGLPNHMYSDNGSNFEGADNQLQRLFLLQQNQNVSKVLVNNSVEWHFIPPGAPNFGGLWERAVRSMKEHLKRTLLTAKLTFEEFATVLSNTEACMNSRPICGRSDDLENIDVLTPGHFLIGQALLAPPQPLVSEEIKNYRNRWTLVQTLTEQLWRRWSTEYLVELQQRHKWKENSVNAKPGDIVAVKDENLGQRNWLVGRIKEVQMGTDGRARVATIRVPAKEKMEPNSASLTRPTKYNKNDGTKRPDEVQPLSSKLIQRPIRKLCPLIMEETEREMVQKYDDNTKKSKQHPPGRTYNLRSRAAAVLTVALVFFGLFVGTTATGVKECTKIEPLVNNAGIYYESMGKAYTTQSDWNMIVYFDLEKFDKELELVNNAIQKLSNMCKLMSNNYENAVTGPKYQCSSTINLLRTQFNDMMDMHSLIQMNKQATRIKRVAPFAGVGWLGHALFGIMDADSAERIEQQIATCQQDYNYQRKLIEDQTSVIDLTTNLMKESQIMIDKKFNSLSNAMSQLHNETDLVRKREQLLGWVFQLSLIIDRLEKIQHNIINMLTDLQQGHVSSYLFTPKQFKHELETINDHIPSGQRLPLNPQHDMTAFYEIMRGQMRVTKNSILIQIHLPLVSIEEFQVYHLIPVPIRHGHEHISIIPESPYLLITLKRNTFYQMNEQDLNQCIKPHGTAMICPAGQPINSVESSRSKCERDLLTGQQDFGHCHILADTVTDVWTPLKTSNKWIYTLKETTLINIVQSSNVDTVTLQGSGILVIQPGCELSHDGVTITGRSSLTTTSNMDFTPLVNLSDFVFENHAELDVLNITVTNPTKFDEIHTKLNKIHNALPPAHEIHHVLHHGFTTIMILGAFIALIYTYRHQINDSWKKWRTNDQPQHGDHQIQFSAEQDSVTIITNASHSGHGPGECPFRT